MSTDTADDEARKRFLATLTDTLDARWTSEYEVIEPFRVLGIRLRCAGVEGLVRVVPSVVSHGGVSWNQFPGTGAPHFDIKPDGGGSQRTCVLAEAGRILETWARSKADVVRSAPVPMLELMRPRLEAIAAAALPVLDDAIDVEPWKLSAVGQDELAAARAAVDPAAVARAFPRDAAGDRLALDAQALLAKLDSGARVGRGREVFLSVKGPRVRRDGERLELAIVEAIDENESHDWRNAPWMWRKGAEAPAVDQRANEYCRLVDAGRFDEALALFSIEMTSDVIKIVEAVPLSSHSTHQAEWQRALRRALWELAPWQLPAKSYGRMALMPHQTGTQKGWIAWSSPRSIEWTSSGSNERMSEVYWKRSVDYDLQRLGIARAPRPIEAAPIARAKRAKEHKPLADAIAGKPAWKVSGAERQAKERPARDAMTELLAIASGGGPDVERANALYVARAIAGEEDGPALARFLDDPAAHVVAMAIECVKQIRYKAAAPAIAMMVNATQPIGDLVYKSHLITALRAFNGTLGASGMVPYFTSEDPRLREAACRSFAVSSDGHKLVRPHIERCTQDADAQVAAAAETALAAMAERAKERL